MLTTITSLISLLTHNTTQTPPPIKAASFQIPPSRFSQNPQNDPTHRGLRLRTVNGARPWDSDLRRSQIRQAPLYQWQIRNYHESSESSRRRRLRRARIPRHRRQVLAQRRVDRVGRCLRHCEDLGDPQRLRSEERVQGPLGSDRRPPVVP